MSSASDSMAWVLFRFILICFSTNSSSFLREASTRVMASPCLVSASISSWRTCFSSELSFSLSSALDFCVLASVSLACFLDSTIEICLLLSVESSSAFSLCLRSSSSFCFSSSCSEALALSWAASSRMASEFCLSLSCSTWSFYALLLEIISMTLFFFSSALSRARMRVWISVLTVYSRVEYFSLMLVILSSASDRACFL
mmetsp:Transcript_20565/g.31330  ORF Transcript_20565/g.31330 Transcript_20565/m.31330 type:complete len:200 (+) Transcript_20565:3528-4127(+)